MAANAAGLSFDKWTVYEDVMGKPFSWPGEPATFDQLDQAAACAARMMGRKLTRWNETGKVKDIPNFLELVRQQQFFVEAGIYMRDLVNVAGSPRYNDFYHYVVVRQLDGSNVLCVDSFRRYDGGRDQYDEETFLKAMGDNWDPVQYAYAWRWE
jgi:hypothetical protein